MSFTIPDKGEGLNDIQSILFQEYIDVLVAGISGVDAVLSGCAVTAQAAPDMTVAVAAGSVRSADVVFAVTAGNGTVTAADATNPRLDLVVITSAGAIAVRAGVASSAPKPAARVANDVVLAVVFVPAADDAIDANQIVDLRTVNRAITNLDATPGLVEQTGADTFTKTTATTLGKSLIASASQEAAFVVLNTRSDQTSPVTAGVKSRSDTGDVYIQAIAIGATSASLKHIRGGNGFIVVDDNNNVAGIAATNTPVITGSAPVYACRAWVNFNGTGTVAIRASGNVSSITDNGVGDYTVNFTTAMPDANYAAMLTNNSHELLNTSVGVAVAGTASGSALALKSTTQLRIVVASATAAYDYVDINAAFFR